MEKRREGGDYDRFGGTASRDGQTLYFPDGLRKHNTRAW